jgi:uncharacterized protein (DUF1697 family)
LRREHGRALDSQFDPSSEIITFVASVVFLRAINVGGANLCKPAQLAKQLKKFDVVNIGAVGTFVVHGNVNDSALRKALAGQLAKSFRIKCEIMIASGNALIRVASKNPFAHVPSGPEITRFMSVLHKPLPSSLATRHSSLSLPSADDWLLKIIAIKGQFVLGVYKREMKAIGYLNKLEKTLGVPATTRSWNTIEKVVKVLNADR